VRILDAWKGWISHGSMSWMRKGWRFVNHVPIGSIVLGRANSAAVARRHASRTVPQFCHAATSERRANAFACNGQDADLGVNFLIWTTFTTRDLPVGLSGARRAGLWAEHHAARKTIGRCEVGLASDTPFHSKIISADFGAVSAARASGSPAILRRTHSLIRSHPADHFVLIWNTEERPFFGESRDATFALGAGAAVLLSYDLANVTSCAAPGSVFSLSLSRSVLLKSIIDPERFVARPLEPKNGALLLLRAYVESLLSRRPTLEGEARSLADGHIVDLIAASLQTHLSNSVDTALDGVKAARRLRVDRIIAAHFRNPEFMIGDLAQAVGMSRRSLQQMLAAEGETFSALLLRQRLDHARAALRGRLEQGRSIADIAFESGFGDVSTFNRCYRRHFNERPSDFEG
jgi:AraC-like DNA-binding protein